MGDYEDCLDNLKRKNEEIEAKLKDMDLKMQDFNIADLLKENAKMGDNGEDAQGNNLLLNVVSNLEKKMKKVQKEEKKYMDLIKYL